MKKSNPKTPEPITVVGLNPTKLAEHPNNREFSRQGEEWEDFAASISQQGVLTPLMVRPLGKGHQIICGHRRATAARQAGLKTVPCLVREISDMDALEILLVENMERENPNPVAEALLLREMVAAGADEGLLALRIARSCEWVRQRQMLLDLGDEVLTAMKLPAEDERHLGVGAAAVLLEVPVERRPEAIQLVLHPDWKVSTLNAREARMAVETVIVRPHLAAAAWKKAAPKLAKEWRKRLAEFLCREDRKILEVKVAEWDERMPVCRPAEDLISADMETSDEGRGKRWLNLALKHGLPVWIQPLGDGLQCEAVVASGLLLNGEESCAEQGLECWLDTKAIRKARSAREKRQEREEREEREEETQYDPPPETVIDQTMDSRAVVNLTTVRQLLASATRGLVGAEDWWPEWAKRFEDGNDRTGLVEVLEWFLSLKGGS